MKTQTGCFHTMTTGTCPVCALEDEYAALKAQVADLQAERVKLLDESKVDFVKTEEQLAAKEQTIADLCAALEAVRDCNHESPCPACTCTARVALDQARS